ncbi:MAG: hypothetical protein CH6_4151 [Candidatus Kapaibacterium sp.]|nr:MAG: hypothetical protein CH6_4151 [Candidatus Kapabacteria bacterium]
MRKLSLLLLVVLSFVSYKMYAQRTILANAVLDSISLSKGDQLEFILRLERASDSWLYFANATFQFAFDSLNYNVSPDRHHIELVPGSSDLPIIAIPGILPTVSYIVTPNVLPGRFSITIAGPEEFSNCVALPLGGNGIKIGKFIIKTKDGTVPPTKLRWLEPYIYYQACAYKIDRDSLFLPNMLLYQVNDNIEMDDGLRSLVNYSTFDRPAPKTVLKYFDADYVGLKKLRLSWETTSEAYVDGFIVVRALRTIDNPEPANLNYSDTVADYRRSDPQNRGLLGLGTSSTGKTYSFEFDSVSYRGLEYCYKLLYRDFFGNYVDLAYDCERIPNSIITKATPSPNPFSVSTRIDYIVEDDVILDAFVNDFSGRIVTRLLKGVYTPKGQHSIDFLASYNAQEGLYNVVFIAYPIDDPTVEISRAIVKLQLIR